MRRGQGSESTSLTGQHAIGRIFQGGIIVACLCAGPTFSRGEDWPFFRGPTHNGRSAESNWSAEWPSTGPTLAWQQTLGLGVSSFAVAANRVVTMGKEGDTDTIWCFDAYSGRLLWERTYTCKFEDHNFEGGTSSTPTIDNGHVYTLAYDGQVHCLRLSDGSIVWRKHLVEDFQGRYSGWDYAGSPLIVGDSLVLDAGADGKSTVTLNKLTGELIWGTGKDLAGYATPIPFDSGGTPGVLVFKARALVALRLADGEEMWRIPWKTNYDVNASSPIVEQQQLFLSSGYGGRRARGALFQLEPSGPRQLWVHEEIETKMNSGVVFAGHVYCVSEHDGGKLMCVALKDGRTAWAQTGFAPYGTLMIAGSRLVILDEKGDLVIAEARPDQYRELARAHILNERCWAMPVLANGFLYARNNQGEMKALDVRPPKAR